MNLNDDNLEERLARHMQQQRDVITIETADPSTVATRADSRRRRSISGAVASVVLVAAGIGGWVLASNSTSPTPTAVVADEPGADGAEDRAAAFEENTDDEADGTDDTADDAAAAAVDPAGSEVPAPSTTITTVGSVEAVTLDTTNSPGAWTFGESLSDDGVYYVLSTAPGEFNPGPGTTTEEYELAYRNDTIYSWDENSGWTIAAAPDRFLSDITARDGLLWAVSTGTVSGDTSKAIGTSSDRGQSWSWTPIDLPGASADATVRLATTDGGTFVMAQRLPFADWEEGIELAAAAGLDATYQSVMSVDQTGIWYTQPDPAVAPCQAIETDWWNATYEITEPLNAEYDAFWSEERTPEEMATFHQDMNQRRYDMVLQIAPEFEARLVEAGCTNFIACERISQDVSFRFADQTAAIDAEFSAYFERNEERFGGSRFEGDPMDDPEFAELDARSTALWDQISAETDAAMAAAGCSWETMYSNEPYPEPEFISWESLGVTPPASWNGSLALYRVDGATTTEIPVPFADQVVIDVASTDAGMALTTMSADDWFGPAMPVEPTSADIWSPAVTEWTTADGQSWSQQPTDAPNWYGPAASSVVGDRSFRISWGEYIDYEGEIPAIPAPIPVDPDGNPILVPTPPPIPIDADGNPIEVAVPADAALPVDAAVPVDLPTDIPLPMPGPPAATLELSVAGGPWTAIELSDLAPGVGLEGRQATHLVSSPVGVIIMSDSYGEHPTSIALWSTDGVSWSAESMATDSIHFVMGDDHVMLVGSNFANGDATEILLLRTD